MVDWSNYLFRTAAALAIGFSVVELLDLLLEQHDHEIQEAVDRFRKALEDEYISGIRKDFEAEIEKKLDDCLDNAGDIKKLFEIK